MAGRNQRVWEVIGWIVGPLIWISNLSLMVYGLWMNAWYGYVILAVYLAFVMALWHEYRKSQRWIAAEIERRSRDEAFWDGEDLESF